MYFVFISKILIVDSKFNLYTIIFFNYQDDYVFDHLGPTLAILSNLQLESKINTNTKIIKIFI
jgi:hypothetical protein